MSTPKEVILAGPKKWSDFPTLDQQVGALFDNFAVYFEEKPLKYDAATRSPEQILGGTGGNTAYCENLTGAFMHLVEEVLGGTHKKTQRVDINRCLLKQGLTPVVSDLKYNVRLPTNTRDVQKQFLFKTKHVYCKILSKYYDPLFGIAGDVNRFHVEVDDFVELSPYSYPKSDLGSFLINRRNRDDLFWREDLVGTTPHYVRLKPTELGKKTFSDLVQYYKTTTGQENLYKKYKKMKPSCALKAMK